MICAICGKRIKAKNMANMDHAFPRALYKWAEFQMSEEDYFVAYINVESNDNKITAHRDCNERKEDAIPDIDKLHIAKEQRWRLKKVKDLLNPVINEYVSNKEELLEEQNSCCAECKRPLELKGAVLRRIASQKPRAWDNACVVCHRCNIKSKEFIGADNLPKR